MSEFLLFSVRVIFFQRGRDCNGKEKKKKLKVMNGRSEFLPGIFHLTVLMIFKEIKMRLNDLPGN